jgi:hypothetical protein
MTMSDPAVGGIDEPTMDERAMGILRFFDPAVLAPYREQPDKYVITTDYFEGRVTVTSAYFAQLDAAAQDREYIDVKFGYRTQRSGDLAIAAYLPDLVDHSPNHVERWRPFISAGRDWLEEDQDVRFSLWFRRYLQGDWDVENGPASQLVCEINLINGLAREAVGRQLFSVDEPNIAYPAAQNTHRHEDAHRELYGVLIDGLEKSAIEELGKRLWPSDQCSEFTHARCACESIAGGDRSCLLRSARERVRAAPARVAHNPTTREANARI